MHAIEKIYKTYYNRLLKYAKSLTKEQALAEDLLQDTILKLLEKKDTLRIGHFSQYEMLVYISRTLRNNFLNDQKKQNAAKRQVQLIEQEDSTHKLEHHEKYIIIRQAIEKKFDFWTATAFIAKYLIPTPWSVKKIANEIGESISATSYRLMKCRNYLAENQKKLLSIYEYDTHKH